MGKQGVEARASEARVSEAMARASEAMAWDSVYNKAYLDQKKGLP